MEQDFPWLRKWAKPAFVFWENAVALRVKMWTGSDSCISSGRFSLSFLEQYLPAVLWEFKLRAADKNKRLIDVSVAYTLLSRPFLLLGLDALSTFLELWQKSQKNKNEKCHKHCSHLWRDSFYFPLGIRALSPTRIWKVESRKPLAFINSTLEWKIWCLGAWDISFIFSTLERLHPIAWGFSLPLMVWWPSAPDFFITLGLSFCISKIKIYGTSLYCPWGPWLCWESSILHPARGLKRTNEIKFT